MIRTPRISQAQVVVDDKINLFDYRQGLFKYIYVSITSGHRNAFIGEVEVGESAVDDSDVDGVYPTTAITTSLNEFILIPYLMEKFFLYGMLLCVNSFLFIITFLPVRVVYSGVAYVYGTVMYLLLPNKGKTATSGNEKGGRSRGKPVLLMAKTDLLRAVIIIATVLLLNQINASKIYHLIRAQAIMKLYVFINILDVLEKYLAWFGQEIMDGIFVTSKVSLVLFTIVSIGYTFVHAMIHLSQLMALNVAINSSDNALVVMLISSQFVELKGNVFKKFGPDQILKIACNDIIERFYIVVFVFLISIRNLFELDWDLFFYLKRTGLILVSIVVSEVVVDWLKHVFMMRFNMVDYMHYNKWRRAMYRDVVYTHGFDSVLFQKNKAKKKYIDHLHLVTRSLGFIPLPICCVFIQILLQSVPKFGSHYGGQILFLFWVFLLLANILINIILLGIASKHTHL